MEKLIALSDSGYRKETWKQSIKAGTFLNSACISNYGEDKVLLTGTYFHSYPKISDTEKRVQEKANSDFAVVCYSSKGHEMWRHNLNCWQGVYWTGISDNGAIAVAGGSFDWKNQDGSPGKRGFLHVYETSGNGSPIFSLEDIKNRVSCLSVSASGKVILAVSDELVLLVDEGGGKFKVSDRKLLTNFRTSFLNEVKMPTAVSCAISSDGLWFAVGEKRTGYVYLFENQNGKLHFHCHYYIPYVPDEISLKENINTGIRSIRISDDGQWIAVGGNDSNLYCFNRDKWINGRGYSWRFPLDQRGSIYGVTISKTGDHLAVVGNFGEEQAGRVYILRNKNDGQLLWKADLERNPNAVSFDQDLKKVIVSDGHPVGTPGNFYCFDFNSGAMQWRYRTPDMSWPCWISKDGRSVVGGDDEGTLYYFDL